MADYKKTVLYEWHVAKGANMAPFGQYMMPLWYETGAKAEHLAVIQQAGIFDTSHMAVLRVGGSGARSLLQYCFSKDLEQCVGPRREPLTAGRCVYGMFLNDDGTVLDDAIVYALASEQYMVVVNAGMGQPIADRLGECNKSQAATIVDLTDKVGKFDLQGPLAARLLQSVLQEPDRIFGRFPYFSFKGGFGDWPVKEGVLLKDGTQILLSRTGYTGEFGFEIFLNLADFPKVWAMILAEGAGRLIACGLAARDSLRAGAVLPLSHQDIGAWIFAGNPWLFALPFNAEKTGFTKDFLGGPALLAATTREWTLPFAGYDPRKIVPSEDTWVEDESGLRLGTILTCATDMAIGRLSDGTILSVASPSSAANSQKFQARGLCCGFVKIHTLLSPGVKVFLTDGKKKIPVEIRSDVRPDRTARVPISTMIADI